MTRLREQLPAPATVVRRLTVQTTRVAAGAAISLMALSCSSDSSEAGTRGELGDAIFEYRCENDGDLRCSETDAVDEFELGSDLGSQDSMPVAVAVGATFGIRFAGTASGDDDVFAVVDAVSDADEVGPNVYSIPQPAEAAFLAVDGDQEVIDFTVMTALEATELTLWHNQDDDDTLSIDVGESVEVTVAPRSDSGTFLAGALPYDWVTFDDSVASIGELGSAADDDEVHNEGDIEILGVSEGTTMVRVRSGDLEAVLEVEVNP